ncbi:uncharacterized protein LOC113345739 [Papaver somniferum]|uniref:uncharacterized protein LOC113345739 n=1 Tax=Papaver somniferum TaxID=3469 RepID=UPI000E6F9DD8|nr:uncharacterized protein LOC113345739 [Papaver somniferum]
MENVSSINLQVMPGVVRYGNISPIIDKIKDQLSIYKGKILSFQDRVVLIKSVIASYSIHNMVVYKWPEKFIQQCERVIRNFLWSGDSNMSRAFVVGFDKVCSPYSEGGLGLVKMEVMKKALLMKLWWNIKNSSKKWARFLEAKFTTKEGVVKDYYVKSSIFPGIRWVHKEVDANSKSLLGDSRATSLYFNICYGNESLADIIGVDGLDRTARVSDLIQDGGWVLLDIHLQNLTEDGVVYENLPSLSNGPDMRVWMPDLKGRFSVSSARDIVRTKYPAMEGAKPIWRGDVHPSLEAQNWKFMRGACATLDKVSGIFALKPDVNPITSYKAASGRSHMVKDLWLVANLVISAELWYNRNKITFKKKVMRWNLFMQRVFKQISDYSCNLKGDMHNTVEDVCVLDFFRVRHRKIKHAEPIDCFWSPLDSNELLICCDGASQGNPGSAGAGVIARDANCGVVGAMSIGLGLQQTTWQSYMVSFWVLNGLCNGVIQKSWFVQIRSV